MNKKITELKSLFEKFDIDFYLVPSQDEFLGEYTTEHTNRLKYITGFSGSNGLAIFSKTEEDYFYTDGRYLIQAKNQLQKGFEILDMVVTPMKDKLAEICKSGAKIGIDARMHNAMQIENLLKVIPEEQIICLKDNLVDLVWEARPKRKISDITLHPLKYSGEKTLSKKNRVLFLMQESGIDFAIITDPHSVCWLLNIRGNDLEYTPLVLARVILHKNGEIALFCPNPYSEDVKKYFEANKISVFGEDEFESACSELDGKKVFITNKASYFIKKQLSNAVMGQDYCDMLKACKNKTEIQGAIDAHIEDAKAVSEVIEWIYKSLEGKKKITELDVSNKVLELRKKGKDFVSPSFPTIAGFKEHGAIIHYIPSKETNKEISDNGILLIDSGGQYYGGTTDITRTIAIGEPSKDQIHDFTLVLKGFIGVASRKFDCGTTGANLDVFARKALIEEGKDYSHGTGHGVGSFLSVHEGPHSISKYSTIALSPGMIVSIEPGFYKEGEYGIRIENLAFVKESTEKGKLEFQMLTLVPIQEKLVDFDMLTDEEKEWLKEYNSRCNL